MNPGDLADHFRAWWAWRAWQHHLTKCEICGMGAKVGLYGVCGRGLRTWRATLRP